MIPFRMDKEEKKGKKKLVRFSTLDYFRSLFSNVATSFLIFPGNHISIYVLTRIFMCIHMSPYLEMRLG
jgi:hypothetical protein